MSIFIKIFLTISISAGIFLSLFVNHIINTEEEISIQKLQDKISHNEKIYVSTLSQLLFDLNKDVLYKSLAALYLDSEIAKIDFVDYSLTMSKVFDNKNISLENSIKSKILLISESITVGELHIYYTKDIINNHIKQYKYSLIEFSILFSLLLFGVLFYFIHTFTKSIKKLIDATTEITSGNLNYKIDIQTLDEIGLLSNKFEIMRTTLKDRIQAVNQQLEFQQLLIDTVNVPIYIKDTKCRFISCNKSFTDYFGLKKSQIIGKSICDIQDNEFVKIYEENDKEIFKNRNNENYNTQIYNFNNDLRDVISCKSIYYDQMGEIAGLVGVIIDITEINKAKEEIEKFNIQLQEKVYDRTKELEKSNKELTVTIENLNLAQKQLIASEKMASLGGLVAGVAHEINTPVGIGLTGITHLSEITDVINNNYKQNKVTEEDFQEYLKTSQDLSSLIYKNLEKAASLVKSFKQVSVDQSSDEKREFNLNKYMQEILSSIHSVTKKSQVKIEVRCSEDININSYPGAYSQIITNLIMNSLIHGFKNKENPEILIDIKDDDNQIKILYKDNGTGIKKENISKIFDPFFTTNRDNGGSGLGLNIIYNIITSTLKGNITCTSEENKGVEFLITMDLKNHLDS